jgi:methanethiol S-methyltransferase
MTYPIFLLILSWLIYFLIHSVLASIWFKSFVASLYPRAMPYYRLTYNSLATLLLLVPLGLTFSVHGDWLWRWTGVFYWVSIGISVLALAGFLWSLKFYDTREFLGFRQLSERIISVDDQEHFHLSPLHRWVRHPWYFFALLLIWARDMNVAMLISSIMMTLYFVMGSRFEERKLIRYHGERYRAYRELVPGLIPLPWKYLSKTRMRKLLEGNGSGS